jgi:hypothetical protein
VGIDVGDVVKETQILGSNDGRIDGKLYFEVQI